MTQDTPLPGWIARKHTLEAAAAASPTLEGRLQDLRRWQSARLAATYRDFQEDPRFAPATAFFLTDLYGPHDFTARNRDLERAWRYLKRALPVSLMTVLENALELETLSLEFDHAMVRALDGRRIDGTAYAAAYAQVGDPRGRGRQIELILALGEVLDGVVHRVWIGPLLKAGHAAAHAAGFGALQDFIERGIAAFRVMDGAAPLLAAIRDRETHFMQSMLDPGGAP